MNLFLLAKNFVCIDGLKPYNVIIAANTILKTKYNTNNSNFHLTLDKYQSEYKTVNTYPLVEKPKNITNL